MCADFSEVCPAPLQATPGKASSPISELVKKVRSNLDNVTVYRPGFCLPSRIPSTPLMAFEHVIKRDQTNDQLRSSDRIGSAIEILITTAIETFK